MTIPAMRFRVCVLHGDRWRPRQNPGDAFGACLFNAEDIARVPPLVHGGGGHIIGGDPATEEINTGSVAQEKRTLGLLP